MKKASVNKGRVHTTVFKRNEPEEIVEQKVKAMNEKIAKMRTEQGEKPMEETKKSKKKVALKTETVNTIENMLKEGKSVPSIVEGIEKGHSQNVNIRQIQAIHQKLCYRDKKYYDVPELFKEKTSKEGVLRPIVWSDKRGIMVSAKRIQSNFPDILEHLKGGATTFDIEAGYDKKGKKVTFTLTGKTVTK